MYGKYPFEKCEWRPIGHWLPTTCSTVYALYIDNNGLRKINYSKDDMKVNWIKINDIFSLISCIIWLGWTACLTFKIIPNCIGTLESDDEVHTDLNRVR